MRTLNIAQQFSEYTGLRHCNISEKSGEEFYHQVLNSTFKEAFENRETLVINIDGGDGYASSFLDEAFGNLVYDFTLINVEQHIRIISDEEPHWKEMIEKKTYQEWEKRRIKGKNPKITTKHNSWYRLENNNIVKKIWESCAN